MRPVVRPVLGIDFGTSNSSAAWLDERGRVRVAAVRENVFLLPSVAWYGQAGHMLVGQPARQQMIDEPQNTIFGFKRFLGIRYASPFVHRHKDRFAFELAEVPDGTCGVRIHGHVKPLEDVAVDVLRRLAELATISAGTQFEECVITAPAHYGFMQRAAIRRAATRAGLEVRGMVNEPTAAAMYYARKKGNDGTVLVFDLGGGTFDATLMAIVSGVVKVLASGGDAFLGGSDFDAKLVEQLVGRFENDHDVDLRTNAVAMQRLTVAAEVAKIELSRAEAVRVRVPCIAARDDGFLDLELRLSRPELEALTAPLVERCVSVCVELLNRAKLQALEVDEIVFVGGMTRMPALQRRLAEIFVANPSKNVHPDLGVVVGAALLTQGNHSLIDVTSMAIGVTLPGGSSVELVPANTPVPSVRRVTLERPPPGQPLVFGVYEAVTATSLQRDLLGTVRVPGEWLAQRAGPLIVEAWLGGNLDLSLFLEAGTADKLQLELVKPAPDARPFDPDLARRWTNPGFRSVAAEAFGVDPITEADGAALSGTESSASAPSIASESRGRDAQAGELSEEEGLRPGASVGGYLLLDVLGHGGMGHVYLAEHKRLGRRVALKMLRRRYGKDAQALDRFLSEARAVNQIRHENIIEVTDLFETDEGQACYIMEVLEGRNLGDLLKTSGPPRLERAMRIAVQIAGAMVAVHDAHIVHRDLKPENIFLTQRSGRDDFVKLLDFGVAKLVDERGVSLHETNVGARVGTLDYMPPEQVLGTAVDHRVDVYALGVVLYQMITGQLPYTSAGNDNALLYAQIVEPVVAPSAVVASVTTVPPELDQLLLQCLERDPALRPQTMREVRGRLEAIAEKAARPRQHDDTTAVSALIQSAPNNVFQPTHTGEFSLPQMRKGLGVSTAVVASESSLEPRRSEEVANSTPPTVLPPAVLSSADRPFPSTADGVVRPPQGRPGSAARMTSESSVPAGVVQPTVYRGDSGRRLPLWAALTLMVMACAAGILIGALVIGR